MLVHSDSKAAQSGETSFSLRQKNSPLGGERLWKGVTEPALAARKIRALYETAAVSLVKSNGDVIGVLANQRGKRIAVRANRAVVLTCGGFENNPTMIHTYLAGVPRIYPAGTPYNTGDGIRMGLEVSADLWHMASMAARNSSSRRRRFRSPDGSTLRTSTATYSWPVTARASWLKARRAWEPIGTERSTITACGCNSRRRSPIHLVFDESFRKAGSIGESFACWDVSHGNLYDWSEDNLPGSGQGLDREGRHGARSRCPDQHSTGCA